MRVIRTTVTTRQRPTPRPWGVEPQAPGAWLPGEDVLTDDGALWFHPYNGSAPWKVETP